MAVLQNVYRNGHTYLLVDEGDDYSWGEAQADALALGGYLVTLNDAAEDAFVYGTFSPLGKEIAARPEHQSEGVWFWIGINDEDVEGTFEWIGADSDPGGASSYLNWATGQPNANNIPNQDYGVYTVFFDDARWYTIPDTLPTDYALAIIEIPRLLATAGKDTIDGGIAEDRLIGLGGPDVLRGLAGDDDLTGSDGDDTLDGGSDADTMRGGKGNDAYLVDSPPGGAVDKVIEKAKEGTDTVRSAAKFFTLPDNVENLVLLKSGLFGTGNGAANRMGGSNGKDQLDGAGGNDRVEGKNGDDTLYGGAGDDTVIGGSGDDSLIAISGKDELFGGAGRDRYGLGSGKDAVILASVADIGNGKTQTTREGIAAFRKGQDKIDLSAIDANGKAAGDAKFKFIGADKFSKKPGELRAVPHNESGIIRDHIVVEGDVNGDGKADFSLQLDNFGVAPLNGDLPYKLGAGDFVL